MADDKKAKPQLVDLSGIGNLFEHLVTEGAISYKERDITAQEYLKLSVEHREIFSM